MWRVWTETVLAVTKMFVAFFSRWHFYLDTIPTARVMQGEWSSSYQDNPHPLREYEMTAFLVLELLRMHRTVGYRCSHVSRWKSQIQWTLPVPGDSTLYAKLLDDQIQIC